MLSLCRPAHPRSKIVLCTLRTVILQRTYLLKHSHTMQVQLTGVCHCDSSKEVQLSDLLVSRFPLFILHFDAGADPDDIEVGTEITGS